MDKKSKIFFLAFFLLIAGSVTVTYYRYIVARDYIIQAEADCDPYTEACFVHVCDPEADGECTNDPVQDTSYYKLINRNAKNIPSCDPNDLECEALTCPDGEIDCEITLCDPEAEEDVECSDPVIYTEENPIEEEEMDSEEVDEAEEVGDISEESLESEDIEGEDISDETDTPEETVAP